MQRQTIYTNVTHKRPRLVIVLSVILALTVVALVVLWARYGYRAARFEATNYAMGTYIQQTVYGRNAEQGAANAAAAIGDLENLISWRVEDSDIAKLNDQAGSQWTTIDPVTTDLLALALEVAEKSDGAFDPTILPVTMLWDFGGDNQHVPSQEDLNRFLPYVNYEDLRVDVMESSASLKYHYMGIDLGALGKGAAADEAVAAYEASGVDAAVVAVGGSVGVYGEKKDGSLWSIAVRDPKAGDEGTSLGTLEIASGFVSTSGSYEKTFEENGSVYHHLLNPKTGMPENNGLVSVTVTHTRGAVSDALSTACFIMDEEKGRALLEEYGAGGIFIYEDGRVVVTENLKDAFRLTETATYRLES